MHPGTYRIPANSCVIDAIQAAKGLGFGADQSQVDFYQPLNDSDYIYIPGEINKNQRSPFSRQ